MTGYCATCGRTVGRHHGATVAHRATASRRAAIRSGPARDGGTPTALHALRHWDAQYSEDDPGNSPEWTAAYRAAGRTA